MNTAVIAARHLAGRRWPRRRPGRARIRRPCEVGVEGGARGADEYELDAAQWEHEAVLDHFVQTLRGREAADFRGRCAARSSQVLPVSCAIQSLSSCWKCPMPGLPDIYQVASRKYLSHGSDTDSPSIFAAHAERLRSLIPFGDSSNGQRRRLPMPSCRLISSCMRRRSFSVFVRASRTHVSRTLQLAACARTAASAGCRIRADRASMPPCRGGAATRRAIDQQVWLAGRVVLLGGYRGPDSPDVGAWTNVLSGERVDVGRRSWIRLSDRHTAHRGWCSWMRLIRRPRDGVASSRQPTSSC